MEQLRDKNWTLRLNANEWQMLEELSKKYKQDKSVIVRTLIYDLWKKN